MDDLACVYQLTFPNGKSYIGATRKTAAERFSVHLYHARRVGRGKHTTHTQPVHYAISKYGAQNVKVTTLMVADIAQCFEYEMRVIAELRTRHPNGYNLTAGGEGVRGLSAESRAKLSATQMGNSYGKGHVPSAEKRSKISASNKGHTVSAETREKIGAALRGLHHSQESRERMSAAQKGRAFTSEWKAKISAAKKGCTFSPEHIEKLAAAKRGIKQSPELIAKRTAALKGRKLSEEHKQRIGTSNRAAKRPTEGISIPMPPSIMVGIKGGAI